MSTSPKEVFALAIPIAILVGVCYSYGYWGHFEINALQFVSLVDVAKLAVYPLLFLGLAMALAEIYVQVGVAHVLPPGGGADTPTGHFLRRHWRLLVLGDIFLVVVAATTIPHPYRWYAVGLLVTPLAHLFTHVPPIVSLFPDPRLRAAMLTQVILIVFLALAQGKSTAMRAANGDADLFVDAARSSLTLSVDAKHPAVFLGRLGEFAFVYETLSKRLVIAKIADHAPLVLRRKDG